MIPKIIHQIWVGTFKLPKRETAFIEKVKAQYPDYTHYLWTDSNIPTLPPKIKEVYDRFYSIQNFAFCADILRMYVVNTFGGFYFDIDFEFNPENTLNDFIEYDGFFLYHSDADLTIPNNVFGAEPNSKILSFCIDKIQIENTWYGPSWFGITIKNFFWLSNETPQAIVGDMMQRINACYYNYNELEKKYARDWSLYSWSPEVFTKLRDGTFEA